MISPSLRTTTRLLHCLLVVGAISALVFVWLPAHTAELRPAQITGKVDRVIDGDTIIIAGRRLRLHGIDAPESEQVCFHATPQPQVQTWVHGYDLSEWPCGKVATSALQRIVQDHTLSCDDLGRDRYKRTLARCWDGKIDIERTMVVDGYAVAYLRYSRDYELEQTEAKRLKRGLWGSQFEMPWDWRKAHRR